MERSAPMTMTQASILPPGTRVRIACTDPTEGDTDFNGRSGTVCRFRFWEWALVELDEFHPRAIIEVDGYDDKVGLMVWIDWHNLEIT
jgi:hypothetical protein